MKLKALIRVAEHGQTALDAKHHTHGDVDSPLTAKGRGEAKRLGRKLREMSPKPEVIYSSPKMRTRQTAEIAGKEADLPVRVRKPLRNLPVGDIGSVPEDEAHEKLGPYFKNPHKRIPGAGTVAGWRRDLYNEVHKIAARHPHGTAVIVTHSDDAGAINARAKGTKDGLHGMANPPGGGSVHNVRYPLRKP